MEPLGQKLRSARERKRITTSQAAAQTRIKVQHIEAMEESEFYKIPAPTYAKGFIKMYAEFLGLDPVPLVREYTERYMQLKRPSIIPEDAPPAPAAKPRKSAPAPRPAPPPEPAARVEEEEPLRPEPPRPKREPIKIDWSRWVQPVRKALGRIPWVPAGAVAGIVVGVVLLVSVINRGCATVSEKKVVITEPHAPEPMAALVQDPPAPFIQERAPGKAP